MVLPAVQRLTSNTEATAAVRGNSRTIIHAVGGCWNGAIVSTLKTWSVLKLKRGCEPLKNT